MSSFVNEIPLLDIKGLSEKAEDLQEFAKHVKDAFSNIGFIAVSNHNISADLVSNVSEKVRTFLELPRDIKAKYREDLANRICGWFPLGEQILYNLDKDVPPVGDYREALDIDLNNFVWPTEIPGMQEVVTTLMYELRTLGMYLLRLMSIALEIDPSYFTKTHNLLTKNNYTNIRFANYPPIPEGGLIPGQTRCGEHTDWGSITLLLQDEYGGLEVQRRDGSWLTTRPPVGTVLVNVADMMQRWTSDQFVSTRHRVKEPQEEHARKRARRSIVVFINPDADTMIQSLDGKNKYPPILTSDYFWLRANEMKVKNHKSGTRVGSLAS